MNTVPLSVAALRRAAGLRVWTPLFLILLSNAAYSQTQIRTDSSWGRIPSTIVPSTTATTVTGNHGTVHSVPGGVYTITEAQGKTLGSNLFHSFERFSIGTNDAAVFTTQTAALSNIIARVSGPTATSIHGLLDVKADNGATPNFFLINPAGVSFGAGALVDVPAALHVSTANELRFADDKRYKAGKGPDSTLTITAPEAFGFVGNTRAAVSVTSGTALVTFNGGALSVTGGDVVVDRARMVTLGGGDLRVAAVGTDAVEIPLAGALPRVHGKLGVVAGGGVATLATGAQHSGNIAVSAGDITIDSRGAAGTFTGISSVVLPEQSGNAGTVAVTATGNVYVADGGIISSDSYGSGNSAPLMIIAASMTLDGRGNTTAVDVLGESVETGISTSTFAAGGAARAGDVTATISSGLAIVNGAVMGSRTSTDGDAGTVKVTARRLTIDELTDPRFTGISSEASRGTGNAGDVEVAVAEHVSILNGGLISADTFSDGGAGVVKVSAQSMSILGSFDGLPGGISNQSNLGSSRRAGRIEVSVVGDLLITNGGIISSSTLTGAPAGAIKVSAGRLTIDGQGNTVLPTGILSATTVGAAGDAGAIEVLVDGNLVLVDGAAIASGSVSAGNAGSVKVIAGAVSIDGNNRATGISANAARRMSSGRAGNVEVSVAGHLSVIRGGRITSGTNSSGNGGSVQVRAGSILLDNGGSSVLTGIGAGTAASGDGGDVDVTVTGNLSVMGSAIISSSSSGGSGNAGSIKVRASNVMIDGSDSIHLFGIQASTVGSGNAGNVEITVSDELALIRGGLISVSNFAAEGHSGSITVKAGSLLVDGSSSQITASAERGSSGQTGSVTVTAAHDITLQHGGRLSIRNDATVGEQQTPAPTVLFVSAPSIRLTGGTEITAASTGNVSASDIHIQFTDRLVLDPGSITTSARQGNGGGITIRGNGLVWLDHSYITTSTDSGNGGDIRIGASLLLLETGFIQANTGGVGSSGGKVDIAVQGLLSSGNTLSVAAPAPFTFQPNAFAFNVIQAAAPAGVSGVIGISAPVLDIAGELSGLKADVINYPALGKDLCRVGAGSSLTPIGRGGLRPSAGGLIRPDSEPNTATAAAGWPSLPPAAAELLAMASAYDCK